MVFARAKLSLGRGSLVLNDKVAPVPCLEAFKPSEVWE